MGINVSKSHLRLHLIFYIHMYILIYFLGKGSIACCTPELLSYSQKGPLLKKDYLLRESRIDGWHVFTRTAENCPQQNLVERDVNCYPTVKMLTNRTR